MTVADEVKLAQAGDRAAFGRLAERFGEMATRSALAWLGDLESARDAAQDAFIDAYLHLDQLVEPAAFPGWLRRIVVKHCDRRTRRKDVAVAAPAEPPLADDTLAAREEHAHLRRAIEELPEHERLVVALQYLGEEPQQDVADFLELPLSTVKKRLRTARRRLGERAPVPPPSAPAFADGIQLFLAIRAGDLRGAEAIIARSPSLLDAREDWSDEEALAGEFTLAHRSTPLLVASARGDTALVDMLLRRGARIDEGCGCASGETPLWAAVLHGHTETARRLLAAGADPDRANAVGHTPLHLAAMRGRAELTSLLLENGANPARRARNGLLAADHHTRRLPARSGELIETGIKAVDLFAPLAPGTAVRVQGAAETGLYTLLAELTRRLGDGGWPCVWASWARRPWQRDELATAASDYGIDDCTEVSIAGLTSLPARAALFVFQEEGHAAEIEAALPRLIEQSHVVFVIDSWLPVTRGERVPPALRPPWGAVICTSRALAAEGIYPAIDPALSASRTAIAPEHRRIQEQARALLRAGEAAAPVKAFMRQLFIVCEHQYGKPGERVSLAETLAGFARLTRG